MYIFIVNPSAGNGKAKKVYSELTRSKEFNKRDSRCFFTKYHGHAEEISAQLYSQYREEIKVVFVIGGDGTLHEVMNGLSGAPYAVSFIPTGSGNDFARGCGIKGSPKQIFKRTVSGESKQTYWPGGYRENNQAARQFVNSIGFGFDAEIANAVNESVYKRFLNRLRIGKLCYVIALIQELFRFRPMTLEITVDGHNRKIHDCWMVTVANHPYYGGGMKIIPEAVIQPDRFSVLIIHSISKWKVLALFMTVFTGRHTRLKEVEIFSAERLAIKSSETLMYQVDGQTGQCEQCMVTKQYNPFQVMGA